MSGSINKVILVGCVGRDPELRYTQQGKAVCSFSIATDGPKRANGENGETEWHRIVLWEKLAEIAGKYLTKGRQVYLEGRLRTRQWEKDGVKHSTTEIVGTTLQLLGNRGQEQARTELPAPPPEGNGWNGPSSTVDNFPGPSSLMDEDIPF